MSNSHDPGRIARLVYTYIHLFLVAGIILAAVGDELVLAHPAGIQAGTTAVVVGGPAFSCSGRGCSSGRLSAACRCRRWSRSRRWRRLRSSTHLAPLAVMTAAATLVLVASAAWEGWVRATHPARET